MGQNQSITQTNTQQTINNIAQISNEKCVNLCIESSGFNIHIENSTVGNIDITESCIINGTSCILKAAFSQDVLNQLANIQKGSVTDEEDFSNFLNTLAETGSSQNINQNNYQEVTNNSTQQLNGVCMNKAENSGPPTIISLNNDKAGNIKLSATDAVSNTQCAITNLGTDKFTNDLSNSQSASLTREGMFGALGFLILIAILVALTSHKKHTQKGLDEQKELKLLSRWNAAQTRLPVPSALPKGPPPVYTKT